MNIKELIFKQVQKRHPRTVTYQSYKTAKRVLILFESDPQERNVQLKALVKQLKEDGKNVTAWGFIPKKVVESGVLRDYRILGLPDFGFFGLPQEGLRREISGEHFDLIIDLNINNLLPLRYISVYANADFRAGRQTEPPYVNDLMIDVKDEKNPAYLFDQIIHYIKAIEVC